MRAILIALAMAAAPILAAQQQPPPQQTPPRFTAGTDSVLVDVLVTRDGKPVEGLTAADFVVRDAGTPQKVELAAVDSLPVNLLLALDTSASVRGEALDHLKEAAKAAVAALRISDQAALLTFANTISLRAPWTANRQQVTQAIDAVAAQGATALSDATFTALGIQTRPGSRTLVLLFTDGDDTASWLSASDVVETARRSEGTVYGVTLPRPTVPTKLDQAGPWLSADPLLYRAGLLPLIARETGGESLQAASSAGLRTTFVDVVSRFNRRYVLTFTPSSPAPGWHPLEVEVKTPGAQVSARRGYTK